MKVLMVEPGETPYETEIEPGLKALQEAVGGNIQAVYPYEDPVALICNEDGKLEGLPLNRGLSDEAGEIYDIIAGDFLIVGLGEESFADLSPDMMEKYRKVFEHSETFVRIAGKYLAVKQPVPSAQEQEDKNAQMAADAMQEEELRLDDSTDLAFDLDEFFRQNSSGYAEMFSAAHAEKERLADALLEGETWKIRMRLASVIQEDHLEGLADSLWQRISSYEKEYGLSSYSVYQLSDSDSADPYRFMSYDRLKEKGLSIERDHYRMVYAAELTPADTLDTIFEDLNLYLPENYKGHSLSVSDIVVLHEKGSDTAYFVDSIGFQKVPEFLDTEKPEAARTAMSILEKLDSVKKEVSAPEPKTGDKKSKDQERS